MTATQQQVPAASGSPEPHETLSEILKATASSFTAARAVMETAARTAFAFFADASEADRAALMGELSDTALAHDAILAGYANALDGGVDDPNALVKLHGYRSVAELLQHELGRRRHDTAQLIRLGHVIRDGTYPTLAVAVEDGRVSLHQAGVIVSVLDEQARHYCLEDIEAVEAAATDFATGCDTALPLKPEQLQKLVRAWFQQRQPEKVELDTTEQHRLRSCTYGTSDDGMIRLRALLPATEGAAVMQFLDANAAPKVRFTDPDQAESSCCCTDPDNQCGATYLHDRRTDKNGVARALASDSHSSSSAADDCTDSHSRGFDTDESAATAAGNDSDLVVTTHCPGCAPIDTRTRKQKMADAFTNAFQVAAKTKETSKQGGACPTLTVTIPIGELDKHASGVPALATVQRTEEIVPAHVAARILCDGAIQATITGDNGEILHLGRSRRLFTPAQRTALILEYPSCAVDDCDIPSVWCEAHHVTWWSHGGKTDIDNGILLCNYHHHQVHTGNLTIVPDTRNTTGQRDPSGAGGKRDSASSGEPGRRRWRVQRATRVRNRSSRKPRPGRFLVDVQLASAASQPSGGAKPPGPADLQQELHRSAGPIADHSPETGAGTGDGANETPPTRQPLDSRPAPGTTTPKRRGNRSGSDKTALNADDDSA